MRRRASPKHLLTAAAAAILGALVTPVHLAAHIERPAYWPKPSPDRSIHPPAGGAVPKARSLASALDPSRRGDTRVVCKPNSLRLLKHSINAARKHGFDIRPHDHRQLGDRRAGRLLDINRKLEDRCGFHNIQPAVTASGNNDRVVVMPGIYREPESRAKPTGDPRCDKYETNSDRGDPGALSYKYQVHCPNDQNLIAVIGRRPGNKPPPDPPRWDRHGIPDLGRCIRCNFQIEGSGVSADDVVVDAGRVRAGNGGPNGMGAKKDVGIRADRADGFVLRRMTFRHAGEHGIYVLETDGYRLDRFKVFYNRLYGVLSFVEDHGLMQNCEGVGHGDSALYPGAAAETGEQRRTGTKRRYNQEIRRCDLHHNLAGYSGTDGNAVRVDHNNVYGNALGLQTDVVTAAGHPGYPSDSALFDHNRIYSNNFNPYVKASDIEPSFPFPVGTGLWIAGGNNHTLRDNRIYDNWRRGTMQFAVPDALICGPGTGNSQKGCDPSKVSTSHRNRYHDNLMGIAPGGKPKPNGLDFWWDSFPGNTANCWYRNRGAGPITSSPEPLPDCDNGKDPNNSIGTGDPANEGELTQCLVAYETGQFDPAVCPWFETPPKPGSQAALKSQSPDQRARQREAFFDFCHEVGPVPTCEPFEDRLPDR